MSGDWLDKILDKHIQEFKAGHTDIVKQQLLDYVKQYSQDYANKIIGEDDPYSNYENNSCAWPHGRSKTTLTTAARKGRNDLREQQRKLNKEKGGKLE